MIFCMCFVFGITVSHTAVGLATGWQCGLGSLQILCLQLYPICQLCHWRGPLPKECDFWASDTCHNTGQSWIGKVLLDSVNIIIQVVGHTHLNTHTHAHAQHSHTHMHTHHTCMQTHIHKCTHHTHARARAHTHTHAYAHACTCTHTHTHHYCYEHVPVCAHKICTD